MSESQRHLVFVTIAVALASACDSPVIRPQAPEHEGIHSFAGGCVAVDITRPGSDDTRWLTATEEGYAFEARTLEAGTRFRMRASDLGHYLLLGDGGAYLLAQDGALIAEEELLSDVLLVDDAFVSPAEWELQPSSSDDARFQFRHLQTGEFLSRDGLVADEAEAGVVALYPVEDCLEFPELSLDAEGVVMQSEFDDGDVFGIVDTHSHMFSNFGFGGGGIFHGSPFHRLGVEHALSDCSRFHGSGGRADLFGFGFDQGDNLDTEELITSFVTGLTPERNHDTAGYPAFTDWPNAPSSSTHQTQYYRWVERAYMAGLRLIVQHATSNEIICSMMVGNDIQRTRYSCNDMVATDRVIEETYNLERYIDAQHGGPGRGWFRVVTSPAEARDVIREGRLAVVLGIEVSNLFDCFVTPRAGFPACDGDSMRATLDRYHDLGVRVMFPVHKYDNGFSGGDGDRSIIELGNFINSGHWSNFTEDCPDIPTVFDRGNVAFSGINMPRDTYDAPPPHDFSGFEADPIGSLFPFLDQFTSGELEGNYCQNAGITPLGEELILEMMQRGMVIEIDHFNRRAYQRVFEMLVENDYPAAGTHGLDNNGELFALGGISKTGLGRCHDPATPGTSFGSMWQHIADIEAVGGYPSIGFGFDLNGFAGAPGPRFGDRSRCSEPQSNPVSYPFTSFAGDVTFTQPWVGERMLDFNNEGFVHIGMLPELIEDTRRDGVADEELESLFRSAEAYLRMWERAEMRAAALRP